MSGTPFTFPPPPPPPPQTVDIRYAPSSNSFARGRGDKRWERGSRGRGHSQGSKYRGSRGDNQHFGAGRTQETNHAAFDGNQHREASYPLPNYPAVQQPQYFSTSSNSYNNAHPSYPPIAAQAISYPHHPNVYSASVLQGDPHRYNTHNFYAPAQQQTPYQHQRPISHPGQRYASPPVAMGPPIRLGFGNQQPNHQPARYEKQCHSTLGVDHHAAGAMPPYHDSPAYGSRGGRQNSPNGQMRGRGRSRGQSQGRGQGRGQGHGHPNRRGGSQTANSSSVASRKTQVAPAVPSFGNPLPVKPPTPQVEDKKPRKKKKRRVNQLGLTPNTDEHVSSSEEEDMDEEAKLAAAVGAAGTAGQQLEITYKGQTSTLHSSADIASWIEERKKKFPTAARKAENDARLQKIKQEREREREEKKQAFEAEKLLKRQLKTLEKDEQAATQKAKLKVEKLRRKLEKEERRVAKAEAKSLKRSAPERDDDHAPSEKRQKRQSERVHEPVEGQVDTLPKNEFIESLGNGKNTEVAQTAVNDQASNDSQLMLDKAKEAPSNLVGGPLTPTSQPSLTEQEVETKSGPATDWADDRRQPLDGQDFFEAGSQPNNNEAEEAQDFDPSASSDMSVSSDDTLDVDEDDETSSSGSSSTSDSDSDVPEKVSSRQAATQKVRPPRRDHRHDKAICRDFLRTGRCRRGKRCRWRHALPDQGHKKGTEDVIVRPERKSLHQRLLEQQEESEMAEKRRSEQQSHESKDDAHVATA